MFLQQTPACFVWFHYFNVPFKLNHLWWWFVVVVAVVVVVVVVATLAVAAVAVAVVEVERRIRSKVS
jgi:hypothetical protein